MTWGFVMTFEEAELSGTSNPVPGTMIAGAGRSSGFNPNDLQSSGFVSALAGHLVANPQWLLALFRRFWPIPRFRNWAMVTRYDDVREVLGQDQIFQVPFGDKVKALNDGPNFLLGMQDCPDYRRYRLQVMQAFRAEDIASVVTPQAARFATDIVAKANGRLDAVQDLITLVPTLISENYYGVPVPDKVPFGQWTIAMSTFMFGDPTDNPKYRRCALAAGECVRPVIDRAIATARTALGQPDRDRSQPGGGSDTVLARLIAMQQAGAEGLTDSVVRAYLIGMITGFVPTNTMAAGHMLEMLLRRPDFMAQTRAAALAGDDALLKRCLFEAMRFRPLNPGPFRICAQDYTIAKGTSRAKTIKAGTKFLAGTQSAMFDERHVTAPYDFNPERPPADYMLFGYGLHWCIGASIAEAQITQTLKALLIKNNLRRAPGKAGQLQLLGPFPAHLEVEFDP